MLFVPCILIKPTLSEWFSRQVYVIAEGAQSLWQKTNLRVKKNFESYLTSRRIATF
jgi:hypothetical protein